MAESFMPTDPWILAHNRYMEDLDEDEKKIFATASLENLFYSTSVAQKEHEAGSKSRAISSKLEPFVTAIDQYGTALDVISNTYSLAMAPLWGSIRVLLHVARAFEKYFQKLIEMLTRIGDVLPRCRVYQSLFPSHAHLLQSISIAYLDIIRFCTDAKKTFRKLKKSTTVPFALKLFWKDFAGDFEGTLTNFRNHIKNVDTEVSIASMIEGSNERALTRVDRMEREEERQVAERDLLLSKLSSIRYIDKHLRERRKRHPGSGSWLKETVEFKDWMATDRPACLWCHGIPGSGKTILASGLIDTLSTDEANKDVTIQPLTSYEIISKGITHHELIITYYYCDSSDPRSLEARNILGTIIKELLEQIAIPDALNQQLLLTNRPGSRVAESDELVPILLEVLKQFTKAYIFIDGLDECRKEERAIVLSAINKLISCDCSAVKVLVTSQQEVDIAASLKRFPRLELSADRISSDIGCFIKEAVRSCIESGSLVVRTAGLESDIISALADGAQGMFLWVSFQIEDLCDASSDYEIKETLQNLPKGMGATYARILQKISSVRTNMSLAQRVFKWIICAKRPLLITELTEAIAFQPTDRSWNAEKIPDASRTIQACKNLVVLDEIDKTVRLAHHSVRKFLLGPLTQDSIPEFHFDLNQASIEAGELCVAYLSFSDFERQLTTSTPGARRLAGEVPGPSAVIDSVRFSPTSGLVASSIIKMRQRMGKGDTFKQPSSFEFAQLVKLRKPAPPSLLEKYLFLKYAIENWIGHASEFWNHTTRIWSLFKDLAMDKPMPFDIRVWRDMHESYALPYTALFRWAVHAGHVPLLRLLEELPEGFDLRAYCLQDDDEGQSVVRTAAHYGHDNVIELLASLGCIHKMSGEPLIQAAEKGHCEVVRTLLLYDLCLEGRLEAVYKAARARHEVIAHLILNTMSTADLNDDLGALTLFAAVENDWDEIVVLLLHKAVSVTDALDALQRNWEGAALHVAAKRGLAGMVAILLEYGVDVVSNQNRDTAVREAAYNGHLEVVRLLLNNLIYTWETEKALLTALRAAAERGWKEMVQLLLEELNDFEGGEDNSIYVTTILETAVRGGHEEIVLLLLKKGANINKESFYIAANNGDEGIIRLLVGYDHNNALGGEMQAALHRAVSMGQNLVVQLLIESGAGINATDQSGLVPLSRAARKGHVATLQLLLEAGADVHTRNTCGKTALYMAAREGHATILQLLLEAGADVHSRDIWGNTALHIAASKGLETIVDLLLQKGADSNAFTSGAQVTALHLAVSSGHQVVVKLLLEHGANVMTRDANGVTPLHLAAHHSWDSIAGVLIDHGADIAACDRAGMTPLQMAPAFRSAFRS